MYTAVLLSGCGVYDGSEIHESVLTLLSLEENNINYHCVAPDIEQKHVINHINGEEKSNKRNVLEESARIARGKISSLDELDYNQISSLVITGGFGAAKNLSSWAFEGENSTVIKQVKKLIVHCIDNKKPILSLCISPVLISKTLEKTEHNPKLSLGSKNSKSDYNIIDMHKTLSNLGVETYDCSIREICVDENLKIISAPCYMLDAKIYEVRDNINMAIKKLKNYL